MMKIGKRVVDDLYVHLSAVQYLEDVDQRQRIERAAERLSTQSVYMPTVAKLNLRTGRLSLLAYKDFDEDPFPQLSASWIYAPGSSEGPVYRTYVDSLNPPILHRKELLVQGDYPRREEWTTLT